MQNQRKGKDSEAKTLLSVVNTIGGSAKMLQLMKNNDYAATSAQNLL
jgi:hypothetical protein